MATGAVVLTDELRTFIEKKLEKISMHIGADPSALADVEVGTTTAGQRTGDVFRAEINIQFSGSFVRAEAVRDTLHAAIDEAAAEARREVRKKRGRDRDMVRKGAAQVKEFFRKFGK